MSNNPLFKGQVYYLLRRQWYRQVIQQCQEVMAKKGKEPLALFWYSFALGMSGDVRECLRQLESFQARKDLQFPVNAALLFFHRKMQPIDHETVAALKSELSVAEDVAVSLPAFQRY